MNKNLVLIVIALSSSLPWVGCNRSDKLAQSSTFTPPAGPVELKLKWPQGERIVQDMDMRQNSELSIPGNAQTIKQDMTLAQGYELTVLKEDPDGGHEVEMKFLSTRMSMTMGGKTMLDYDSSKKPAGGGTNSAADPVAEMLGKIVGSKIQFFLNASNEVERVEGMDELTNRLTSSAQAILKGVVFSEERFKQMMSANRFIPPKAVQPGDTWPIKQSFEMGPLGTLVTDFGCTFPRWEMHGKRNCARIEFQGTINSTPGTNAIPGGVSMSTVDSNASGVSWFDPELGMTIEMTMNQDMNMIMNIPMNPRGNLGTDGRMQSLTNKMSQVITTKLVSVR